MADDKLQPNDTPPSEDGPGLLHPKPAVPSPPDDYKTYLPQPTTESIEEAASHSHHGVVREPGAKLGREEEAILVLENTVITPAVAWTMTVFFLLVIFSVPLLQLYVETKQNLSARHAEVAAGQKPEGRIAPKILDSLGELPNLEKIKAVDSPEKAWELIPHADQIKRHETELENDSVIVQFVLPRMQSMLTTHGGVGNEQAYCGITEPNGRRWLMYRPDVDYLTSRGFLDPGLLKVRKRAGDSDNEAVQPDPIRAIVDFNEQLAKRGIALIVMPMPVKPMIHPEKLSTRYSANSAPIQNPSFEAFEKTLASQGVTVFNPATALLEAKARTGKAQYLETDTHWTPEAMELSAQQIATLISQKVKLPARPPLAYTRRAHDVANIGDIAAMLKLPAEQKLFGRQQVTIKQVKTPDGKLWLTEPGSDVLLLGDSFSNMYSSRESFPWEGSLEDRGWGEAAGFGEQISFLLKRPLDALINNAGGSHVTREAFVRQLKQNPKRFANTKLVIWEFSMRDLLIGDWKLLTLPDARLAQPGVR